MPGRGHAKRDCSLTPSHPCQAKTSIPRPRELFPDTITTSEIKQEERCRPSKYSMLASHGGLQSRSVTTQLRRKKATTSGTYTQHTTRAHSLALSRAVRAHTHAHSTHQFSNRIASVCFIQENKTNIGIWTW